MPEKHILGSFDQDLDLLREAVQYLAELTQIAIKHAMLALLSGDHALAQKVVESDAAIDQLQQQIFFQMNVVLGRQQAMAQDLREIMAAGRIAAHLERVADHAKNIARRALELDRNIDEEISSQLQWMNDRISTMLEQVMGAYLRRNAAESIIPWSSDTELDIVYGKLFAHLLERMQQNRDSIKTAIRLLFIAKGLEREGDHVTNIAEEVYLMVTGSPLQ
jgi:phosphate transport system protein